MADLAQAPHQVIWTPPAGTSYSRELWAPELHFFKNEWYMYIAADDGHSATHRLYVENPDSDPTTSSWTFKGQVGDDSNKWAIDGSVFEHRGQLYLIWSGWEGDVNGQQNIYIANMKDPVTVDGARVLLSKPEYDWEKHGDLKSTDNPKHVDVNEGQRYWCTIIRYSLFTRQAAAGPIFIRWEYSRQTPKAIC